MNVLETAVHRRSLSRVAACSNVWLQCRRAATDGPNLANGLLDISAGGVQFLAKDLLHAGDPIEIVLSGSRVAGSIRRHGKVRWVVPLGAAPCCAGVQFHKPLSPDELSALATPGDEPATHEPGEALP